MSVKSLTACCLLTREHLSHQYWTEWPHTSSQRTSHEVLNEALVTVGASRPFNQPFDIIYLTKLKFKFILIFYCYREALPKSWNDKLDAFQQILVLRCLRPDKVTNAMQDFVATELGQRFIEPQTADLSTVFKESSPSTPLIFILSAGTDPASGLYKFAEEMKFSKKLNVISLGQGQVCLLLDVLDWHCVVMCFNDHKCTSFIMFTTVIDLMFSNPEDNRHHPALTASPSH